MSWNGIDRRSPVEKLSDHDTLIEVVQILKNHVTNFNSHRVDFEKHIEDDKKSFSFINRTIWQATGALGVIVIILNFILSKFQ